MTKQQRYYEIDGNTAYVYDAPTARQSVSVSIVAVADLAYYRRTFNLQRVWA